MRIICVLFLVFCTKMWAYDSSFSDLIREINTEFHQEPGDWCDRLTQQIQTLVEKYGRSLSFLELQQEGIDPDYLDAMALEYCKKYPDAYLAIVWPTLNESHEQLVYDILSRECLVVYRKEFELKGHGPKTLMYTIPEKIPHIPFDFHRYFSPDRDSYRLRCFVIRAPEHACTVRAKRALRDVVKLDPYCMHLNDTHPQLLDLSYWILNNNSLHFLNTHKPQQFENFNDLLKLYSQFLVDRGILGKDVCVDGSCVLSAYGIRDCSVDFDFLCSRWGDFGNIHPLDHHNLAWERLGLSIHDVIYNPKNFFTIKGSNLLA